MSKSDVLFLADLIVCGMVFAIGVFIVSILSDDDK